MKHIVLTLLALTLFSVNLHAQTEKDPPVIAKMEALGTVYLTRKDLPDQKGQVRKNVIVGVDFRPTAMSDPKAVAEVVRELSTLPDLETVLLLGQPITDDVANAIPATSKLVSLRFFNTKVTDKGIAKLARFTRLQVFSYTGTGLTDEGMKSIAKLTSLNTVTITDAPITDQGVRGLVTLTNLRTLTIENSAASEESVEYLRSTIGIRGIRGFG